MPDDAHPPLVHHPSHSPFLQLKMIKSHHQTFFPCGSGIKGAGVGGGLGGGGPDTSVVPTLSVIMSLLESDQVGRWVLGGRLCDLFASIGVLTRQDRSRGPSWRKGQFPDQVLFNVFVGFSCIEWALLIFVLTYRYVNVSRQDVLLQSVSDFPVLAFVTRWFSNVLGHLPFSCIPTQLKWWQNRPFTALLSLKITFLSPVLIVNPTSSFAPPRHDSESHVGGPPPTLRNTAVRPVENLT